MTELIAYLSKLPPDFKLGAFVWNEETGIQFKN